MGTGEESFGTLIWEICPSELYKPPDQGLELGVFQKKDWQGEEIADPYLRSV